MASGKAAGPSGIVAEMLKLVGEAGAEEVRDLVENIISEGCIPTDWQESFIVNLYKGKGDALDRGNYRGLKLIEQVMKVLERVVEGLIRQRIEIDEMQCGFMSGRGTTDAIFIVRQLQEKHLAVNKRLYMAFVDLEKAFDRVPREVIWWAMRKLGIDEWLVRLVQSMYKDVRSRVRVGDGYSEEFGVGVGVHQGSVLSPLLFIIVLEALSREFRTGCPWELLYADDLMISAGSMEELLVKVKIRWICNVKAKDEVSSDSLLTKLGIQDLDVVLCIGRMRWFGHVERSTGWISEVRKLNVVAQRRSGRPRKSWDEVIKNDRKKLDMDSADPQNRSEWRGRLRGRLVKRPNPR